MDGLDETYSKLFRVRFTDYRYVVEFATGSHSVVNSDDSLFYPVSNKVQITNTHQTSLTLEKNAEYEFYNTVGFYQNVGIPYYILASDTITNTSYDAEEKVQYGKNQYGSCPTTMYEFNAGGDKYIKKLKTIYILEKSLISIGITSLIAIISFILIAIISFIILSKLMFVQIFMGIMLKYIGFIILAYLAMFIIMVIIIMLIHYLSSIKIKTINPKVVVSLIFLVLVNVLLCVCQQNMHFFDYQANVYKEIRKDAMYVGEYDSYAEKKNVKNMIKDYPNTTHYTYTISREDATTNADYKRYYFSDKQFLIDGISTSGYCTKCNIIIQRDEYNYTNDYELAKENNYTYIELYGPSMTSSGSPQTNEEINQRKVLYKYLPNFNDEALTWNEEYVFTSVYSGKKKDLLKIKLNPENYLYIEYGYKERQLLYQLDKGEKLFLSLGYIPILLSIILVFISYNFLVVTEGYDNKIKRLLGMKRFKFFISKIKEGLIIYFIPLIIGLIISGIYSMIKFKAGYSFIALALICGSTVILLIIIALLQLKKTYNGNLIIKKGTI